MYKKLLFFLLVPLLGISQVQIGLDIDGETDGDLSGWSVSLSSNGNIVAIGAIQNNNGIGHVRVYKNTSGVWTQIGNNIDGETAGDLSGWSVSLSSDGNIVAIGAIHNNTGRGHVRVYENISEVWIQIGADIDGEAVGDLSGRSISISSDGGIVAIGSDGNSVNGISSGHVRVFQNLSGVWTQIGSDINGEAAGDWSGYSVSLSSSGNVVAIGAPYNVGNGTDSGHVRVYENISGVWTQIGSDIDGETTEDLSGWNVSLSSDGTVVAIGAPFNDGNGIDSGHVRVYENISGVWTQIGSNIDGEAAGNQSGFNISLSADGSIVAIGAPFNDGNGTNSGHVRIYQNESGNWIQRGVDIDGEFAGDYSGHSISLSSDGKTLAIGAIYNENYSGHVRVYDISGILSTNNFISESFDVYPNPVSDMLNIRMKNNLTLEKVTVYNNSGQIVKTAQQNTVDISNLSSGIYFVEVTTNQGKAVKKVIVK